jgi:predicted regulator of Ras-like GTPase activity (Roadblock/LC7/MglB family)
VDSRFDRSLNYWDLSAIGAALYGVSRQGQNLFEADFLERASIIYNNLQLFAKSIGHINVERKGKREILIVILADKEVNIGVIQLQMDRFGAKIKSEIENNSSIITTLQMNENELKEHIKKLKHEIFVNRISSNP